MLSIIMKYCLIVAFSATPLLAAVLKNEPIPMPKSCLNQTFCFDPHPDYPHDIIHTMLTKNVLGLVDKKSGSDLDNRDDEQEQTDCKTKYLPLKPIYHIVDENEKVRIVVQSSTKFQQIIEMNPCEHPGRLTTTTIHFNSYDIKKYNIICTDVFLDYNFLVLTPDRTGIELAKCKGGIPVSCSCKYYKN